MPKVAKSNASKIRDHARKFSKEFSATPTEKLWCQVCEVEVKYDKTFYIESHRNTQKHKDGLSRLNDGQTISKQTFIGAPTSFHELVVSSFLAVDIRLKKLSHPAIRQLFSEVGKTLPSESAAKNCVSGLAVTEIDRLKKVIEGKRVFLMVDESEVSDMKFMNTINHW